MGAGDDVEQGRAVVRQDLAHGGIDVVGVLDPDGVQTLRAELDRFWNQALATYKEVVEQHTEEAS